MRAVALAGIVAVASFVAVLGFVFATFVIHGDVNAESLHSSVVGAADAPDVGTGTLGGRCRPARQERQRLCWVVDGEGSSAVGYRVRMQDDSSCWDAVGGGRGRPRQISGCVHPRG